MKKNKIVKFFFVFFIISSILLIYLKFFKKDYEVVKNETTVVEEKIYSSNIIENVNYSTKDADGNEYLITAIEGEIDFSNPNIIYLTDVKAEIKLKNSDNVVIVSDLVNTIQIILILFFQKMYYLGILKINF